MRTGGAMELTGAYTADRAAALAGVPKSTIHYWDRKRILMPSVSPVKVKLWSYSDLLGLRYVYWLRQPKTDADGWDIPRTSMRAVRRALETLRTLDMDLLEEGRPTIVVDRAGRVHVHPPQEAARTLDGQLLARDVVDLLAPFPTGRGIHGPDLVQPSTFVRISPRKLSGAPHVVETRVETLALYALELRGFSRERIERLYPSVSPDAIADALMVERQLAENLRRAA
jgi:uncharacterized protein (DUF433 family)